jgi:hypothetical protein
MKIYNKKDFLSLSPGTFFCEGVRWSFNNFYIKGDSLENDFYYMDLLNIDSFDSKQSCERMELMLEKGESFPINNSENRNGTFNDSSIFLVFEKEDLIHIKNLIDNLIK